MKIYKGADDGLHIATTVDLAELGRLFLKLSAKHTKNDWYWVEEEDI